MGMTLKRIAFAALALAAILLPLRSRSNSGAEVTAAATDRNAEFGALARRLRTARLAWTTFDLRDSAHSMLAALPIARARPVVAWRGFGGGASNADADSTVAALWDRIGTPSPDVRVGVLVYNDAIYKEPLYTGSLIETHGDRTDCVAIAPAGALQHGRPHVWPEQLNDALAPCALLAAFGTPGAGVAGWLTTTRYAAALSNSWLMPHAPKWNRGPWAQWSDEGRNQYWQGYGWLQSAGMLDVALLMRPRYEYGAYGLRCLSGEPAACATGVLHPGLDFPDSATVPAELTLTSWQGAPAAPTLMTVRPASYSLVAAIIKEFGRERFAKFWQSNQPFEVAFHDAFGQSLGSWTARWATHEWQQTYEVQNANNANAAVLLGATLDPAAVPLVVGWTVLALAIAAWVAMRRTASAADRR